MGRLSLSQSQSFPYDGDGGRVKQIDPSGVTTFLGDLEEISPTSVITKYLFAGSQRIAAKVGSAYRFYHSDHLGSTNLVTDINGNAIEYEDYTPYGSLRTHEGSIDSPQKFTGQRLDSSTGLYYYHARYYDPQIGRFIQPDTVVQDPSNPQTLNRYSYVLNNPVNITDPTGHKSFFKKLFAIVAAVVVAAFTGQVELPILVAAAFSAATVGAAAAEGALIDRAVSSHSSSVISAANIPNLSSSNSAILVNTGTPFTPMPHNPMPIGDETPDSPRITVGDPTPIPHREFPGDMRPEAPQQGPTIDGTPNNLGQMYNALNASDEPKPMEDVGNQPGESQGADQEIQKGQKKPPRGDAGEIRWDRHRQRWVDDKWVYNWDERPHSKRGGGPHWDRGPKTGGKGQWSPDGRTWIPK